MYFPAVCCEGYSLGRVRVGLWLGLGLGLTLTVCVREPGYVVWCILAGGCREPRYVERACLCRVRYSLDYSSRVVSGLW